MSILKQVLSDAWTSIVRRVPSIKPLDRIKEIPSSERIVPASLSQPIGGLKVVILNWKAGENDPFTVANKAIRHHLEACGKNVVVIEITDVDWPDQLVRLSPIEFALTWQGLGSAVKIANSQQSLWDHLKIPLICLHGDHPCHMPINHELESRYCFHLYTNAEFARYSNRHFRRARGASVIDIPQLHHELPLERRTGDYFVVAKNINDPLITEKSWRDTLPKPASETFLAAAEYLKSKVARGPYVEVHDGLDEFIVQNKIEWLMPQSNAAGYHEFHSQLDHHLRSYKTVAVVNALSDFPLRIYGRGWDRIRTAAPESHVFAPGLSMAASQELYYSRFGVVDVSPSKGLHDRTRRAMVNEVGFLSSANLEDSFTDIARFSPLFFSFHPAELQTKATAVLRDPDGHATLARDFAHAYHEKFHARLFVNRLDHLAKIASNTEVPQAH